MVDPRQLNIVEVVQRCSQSQLQRDRAISAYRNNIALPDVHIASVGDTKPVDIVSQDGKPLTFERRQQLMQGKTAFIDSPDTDRRKEWETEAIVDEVLGMSDIVRRPPLRKVTPLEMTEELMAQRELSECLWSSGSDACATADELFRKMEEALQGLAQHGYGPARVCLSSAGADTIAWMLSHYFPEFPRSSKEWLDLPREIDDSQFHHIQIWAAGIRKRYVSVFLHRGLMQQIAKAKAQANDTQKLPAVDE